MLFLRSNVESYFLCITRSSNKFSKYINFFFFVNVFIDNKKSDDSSEKSICEGPTIVKLDTVVKVTDNSKNKKSCSNDVRHVILDKSRRNSLSEKNLTRYGTIKLHDGCSLCQQCNDFDINCDWCKQEINFKIG